LKTLLIQYLFLSSSIRRSLLLFRNVYPANHPPNTNRFTRYGLALQRIWFGIAILSLIYAWYVVRQPAPESGSIALTLLLGFILSLRLLRRELLIAPNFAGAVAQAQQTGNYDLLCLSPIGQIGASWLICAAQLKRDNPSRVIRRDKGGSFLTQSLITFLTIGVIFTAMANLPDIAWMYYTYRSTYWLVVLVYVFGLMFAFPFEIEFITGIAAIIGMLVPTFSRKSLNAQTAAFVLFLFVQVVTYALIFLIGFVLLPSIFWQLNFFTWVAAIVIVVLRFMTFLIVRAGVSWLLYLLLHKRLDWQQGELDAIQRLIK
jgi:hypothetical protein